MDGGAGKGAEVQMGSGARESNERVQDCAGQYPGSVEEGGRSISSWAAVLPEEAVPHGARGFGV